MKLTDWLTTSHLIMLGLLLVFSIFHSGLAALRTWGEAKVGARFYRIFFVLVNLPMAIFLIVYFFYHRYDGLILWQFQEFLAVKIIVWLLSATSFLFLYPSTFNLLEVAAINKPKIHLHETGILRICRHPQMVGQVIWCIAHTLWIGSSFTVITSLGLIAYHLFAIWHGDHRLEKLYKEQFIYIKQRTSIVPFLAVLDGRQNLLLSEFSRPAYIGVFGFILLIWVCHLQLL